MTKLNLHGIFARCSCSPSQRHGLLSQMRGVNPKEDRFPNSSVLSGSMDRVCGPFFACAAKTIFGSRSAVEFPDNGLGSHSKASSWFFHRDVPSRICLDPFGYVPADASRRAGSKPVHTPGSRMLSSGKVVGESSL